MFNTNLLKVEKFYNCDNDCVQSGCKGHTMRIEPHSTSSTGVIYLSDDDSPIYLDCTQAETLYQLLKELKENG